MTLGISDAVELASRIATLIKQGVTIELHERVLELREAVLNSKEEILALREENSQLKRAAAEQQALLFKDGVYWLQDEDDEESLEGPYCQKCRDADGKLIRLQKVSLAECMPPEVTAGQVVDVIRKYLRDKPERRHYTAASTVSAAVSEAFPCGQSPSLR